MSMQQRSFLHVGCGPKHQQDLKGFDAPDWREIRFDIDPRVSPEIEGTLTDMSRVDTASVDAVYSAHNIEHLYWHEVPVALREFHRVLGAEGFVVITCPDLQSVCEFVARDQLTTTLYESGLGPISALDILYGHQGMIGQGNHYMAHRCGFTYTTLQASVLAAGFGACFGGRRPAPYLDLWLLGFKQERSEVQIRELAATFLP